MLFTLNDARPRNEKQVSCSDTNVADLERGRHARRISSLRNGDTERDCSMKRICSLDFQFSNQHLTILFRVSVTPVVRNPTALSPALGDGTSPPRLSRAPPSASAHVHRPRQ